MKSRTVVFPQLVCDRSDTSQLYFGRAFLGSRLNGVATLLEAYMGLTCDLEGVVLHQIVGSRLEVAAWAVDLGYSSADINDLLEDVDANCDISGFETISPGAVTDIWPDYHRHHPGELITYASLGLPTPKAKE